MLNIHAIDELAQRLSALVPPSLSNAKDDVADAIRETLQTGLTRLNLVTREEFDVQKLVLMRTREKIEALEKEIAALEALIKHKN